MFSLDLRHHGTRLPHRPPNAKLTEYYVKISAQCAVMDEGGNLYLTAPDDEGLRAFGGTFPPGNHAVTPDQNLLIRARDFFTEVLGNDAGDELVTTESLQHADYVLLEMVAELEVYGSIMPTVERGYVLRASPAWMSKVNSYPTRLLHRFWQGAGGLLETENGLPFDRLRTLNFARHMVRWQQAGCPASPAQPWYIDIQRALPNDIDPVHDGGQHAHT